MSVIVRHKVQYEGTNMQKRFGSDEQKRIIDLSTSGLPSYKVMIILWQESKNFFVCDDVYNMLEEAMAASFKRDTDVLQYVKL